jgi:hypothetical protein
MLKHLAGLAVAGLVMVHSTVADAGCSCQCVDGQMQPACTSAFEVPPICALRTCPFGPTLAPPPIGGRSSCAQAQSCDSYGHCVWKQVCPGDKPDAR